MVAQYSRSALLRDSVGREEGFHLNNVMIVSCAKSAFTVLRPPHLT
jgi:hypothetical protein